MRGRGPQQRWTLLSVFAPFLLVLLLVVLLILRVRRGKETPQKQSGEAVVFTGYIDDSIPPPPFPRGLLWGEFLSFRHEARARKSSISSSSSLPAGAKVPRPIVCANRGGATKATARQCDAWGEPFLQQWRGRQVEGLCEQAAESKITCLDAPLHQADLDASGPTEASRVCRFDNAVMNFKKTRVKTRSDGATKARVFERGFLSAQCGESAKDNIGMPLYTPDIEDHHDAVCSAHFNETVLAFSHLNVHSLHSMMQDYFNVLLMLRLFGLEGFTDIRTRAITLLNIDSIRKGGRYHADAGSEFFDLYRTGFRRVIGASDFGPDAKVCFKRLLMPPRPVVSFLSEAPAAGRDSSCGKQQGSSPILQQLCLQLQHHQGQPQEQPQSPHRVVALEHASLVHSLSQGLLGSNVDIVSVSRQNVSHTELVDTLWSASVLVGSSNDELAAMLYLPLGSPRCCGVVRVSSAAAPVEHPTASRTTAALLGFHFAESAADPSTLAVAIKDTIAAISTRPSCLAV